MGLERQVHRVVQDAVVGPHAHVGGAEAAAVPRLGQLHVGAAARVGPASTQLDLVLYPERAEEAQSGVAGVPGGVGRQVEGAGGGHESHGWKDDAD